jgi:hypothetical protein
MHRSVQASLVVASLIWCAPADAQRYMAALFLKEVLMRVLYPNERLTAIRARQQGRLIISWRNLDNAEHLRAVANRFGWPMPTSGLTGWLIDMARHQTGRWPI